MTDNSPSLIPFLAAMSMDKKYEEAMYPEDSIPPTPPSGPEGLDPAPLRSLYADFINWSQSHLQIREGTPSGPPVYTADIKIRKPHLRYFVPGNLTTPFATVVLHSFHSKIDITLHGREITMNHTTRLKKEATFSSPTWGNSLLTWKSRSAMKLVDFELRDATGVLLAQFNPGASWSIRKLGRMDFFGPSTSDPYLVQEIVVTGFSLVHATNMQLAAAGVGSASSAG